MAATTMALQFANDKSWGLSKTEKGICDLAGFERGLAVKEVRWGGVVLFFE